MNRKLPPWIYARRYKTRGGYKRILYYVRFTDWKGVRRTFAGGPDLASVIKYGDRLMSLNRQKLDFDKEEPKVLTLADAIKRFLNLKKDKRSLDKDERSAVRIEDFFGGKTPLNEINSEIRIEEYKNKRRSQLTKFKAPTKNSTINRELSFLRSVLWLHENSLEENPKVTLLAEDNERSRTATEVEFWSIYRNLPEPMRDVVIGYWETPMRESEVLELRWPWINFKADLIELPPEFTKTEKGRLIPLSLLYKAVLLEIKQRQRIRPITDHIHTIEGKPISRFSLYYYWKKACDAVGVVDLWIHDLRGTWCTAKVRAGHDRKFVKAISGHKTDHVFERYVRPTLDDLRRVVGESENGEFRNISWQQDLFADSGYKSS